MSPGKLGSWFMLTIMSYVIVTFVNRPRAWHGAEAHGGARERR
ncbi:hypothetical protein [Burkholderia perseverans]|nr:hypothetical protein [Burkholderia perseverans]